VLKTLFELNQLSIFINKTGLYL